MKPKARWSWVALLSLGGSFGADVLAPHLGFAQEAPNGSVVVRDTTPPKPLVDLEVAYPPDASGEATVVLTLTVERDGSVSAVTPSGSPEPFRAQP